MKLERFVEKARRAHSIVAALDSQTARRARLAVSAAIVATLWAAVSPALAQPIPSPALPGRIERELQPPPTAPQVLPPAAVPAPSAAPLPGKPGTLSFLLKDVVVDGATVYTRDQLREAYADFLGKQMSVDALAQLEEAIATKYRRDGYLLARALVPSGQAIDPAAGVVHVQVFEGYIDKVRLDPLDYEVGERGRLVKETLSKIAGACRPGDSPVDGKPCPLHRNTLERYLLIANDLPGVKASAVIQPSSEKQGAADLFVTITEKFYDVSAKIDNRGSPYNGPTIVEVAGGLNNMTGLYERTTLRGITSLPINELQLVNLAEEVPLTAEGLRFVFAGTHSRSRPGDALRSQNILTNSDSLSAGFSYPWLRTRSENLLLRTDFTWRNSLTYTSATPLFDDRTRVLSVGGSYDLADRWLGINLVNLSVGQGLQVFGATRQNSPLASHAGANGNFTKFNGELSRLQQIFPEWNVLGAVIGQYSIQKLLVAEQFGFGGDRYGRGYDPSEILGDRGIAGKAELQYTPAWGPGVFGTGDWVRNLQFYAFYDVGQVWNPGFGEADSSAASTGGGVRFTFADYLSGYLELARPLTRTVASALTKGQDGKGQRLYFSVATHF